MFNFKYNKSLFILMVINGIFVLGANMFPSIFALFIQKFGGNAFYAGSIWATFAIVSGILIFFTSRFGDRIKEKENLLLVGYFLRILGWVGYIFVTSLLQIYLLQLVLAIGEAFGNPAFNGIFSEHLDRGRYIKEWGLWTAISSIIIGVAAFLGGFIVFELGFKFLFLAMAVLATISFVFLLVQPRKLI